MTCRGVHFAITPAQASSLREAAGDDDAVMEIVGAIEEAWERDHVAESDKAWDAMHRCLTDGRLELDNGEYPLNRVVLGGEQLHEGDDYFVVLVSPKEVKDVARAIEPITEAWFRERYFRVVPKDYAPEHGEQDSGYTWAYFEEVRTLFMRAAEEERDVIFTVSQ